jgi:hypothetical protein
MRGWWGMPCWNGLSQQQQHVLITIGTLTIGYIPMGECQNGAELEITTMYDEAPGPRFYCRPCAIKFLQELHPTTPTDREVSQQ